MPYQVNRAISWVVPCPSWILYNDMVGSYTKYCVSKDSTLPTSRGCCYASDPLASALDSGKLSGGMGQLIDTNTWIRYCSVKVGLAGDQSARSCPASFGSLDLKIAHRTERLKRLTVDIFPIRCSLMILEMESMWCSGSSSILLLIIKNKYAQNCIIRDHHVSLQVLLRDIYVTPCRDSDTLHSSSSLLCFLAMPVDIREW